jgi:hypothetical protein
MKGWAEELAAAGQPEFMDALSKSSLWTKQDLFGIYAQLLREAFEAGSPKEKKKLKKRVQRHIEKLLQAQSSRDTSEAIDNVFLNAGRRDPV